MYLLVNLEGHVANMADIINELVNKYSVPISIVDSIDRACPNCKGQPSRPDPGNSHAPPKDPELPPISPATTTEIIDVKPNRAHLEPVNENYTTVGRRTAAKHSAVARSLEKKDHDLEEKPFSNEIQKLLAQASCSQERESHSPANSYTTNTDDHNSPMDSSVEIEENAAPSVEDFGASLETMHPTLLACLISSTPNVFAQDGSLSPNGDTPPNLIPEGVLKIDESDRQSNAQRILGQLKYSVSSSGKLRRGRIVYNSRDLDVLESFYSRDPNACADPVKKQQMMELLGVDAIRLKVWFQNRRRKDKIKWLKEKPE